MEYSEGHAIHNAVKREKSLNKNQRYANNYYGQPLPNDDAAAKKVKETSDKDYFDTLDW
jgi:hypothetical protein